ncbi:hypothetical protein FB567DRAFT_47056 [Paraphoma chrysanthemicola]|uniref:Uncharacterized protein n=1 Tax=Paraphoma chrysanthemicola TaxID=798071 RepID=A0A8K0RLI3_9PLEO|nr:hypothetical protein FB567DRAFT_47056 [Paraphoma chrysanthemicola]
MYFSTTILFSLAAATLARPLNAPRAAGSRKNVYLATCVSRGLLDTDTSSSVIYYNGPSSSSDPQDVSTVYSLSRGWEGSTKRTIVDGSAFTSSIDAGAASLPKSQIAGTGTLGREQLVCFRDGSSTFKFSEGLLGLRSTTCKAEYWCASLGV